MYHQINIDQRFLARAAADITREVAAADFGRQFDVHTVVLRRGSMTMRVPHVAGPHAEDFHIQRPRWMPWRGEGFPPALDYPAMTISRLTNALVAPGGIAFSENGGYLLSESFGAYWEPQPHISIEMPEHGYFTTKNKVDFNRRLSGETYFYCDSQHIGHFGHFFMDDLTRMWGYIYCRDFLGMRGVKVLTRAMTYEVRQAMNAIGICDEDIVDINEPLVCDDLIVATRCLERQSYFTPLFAPFCRRLREGVNDHVNWPKRIFVSRRGGNGLRRLINEDAVEDVFRQRGFAVMHPSEFGSFGRQTLAFGQAEYLAGLSGTNMYCAGFQQLAKGTFVLVSPLLVHYQDYHMNQEHSGPLTFYVGDLDESAPGYNPLDVNSSWIIPDMEDLEKVVDAWLAA